ncbi:MAG: ribulose-phosphate 3-epimerase [Candidatus Omnitrophota bacterium]
MEKKIQVSASILCADFTRLGEEIKKCEEAGVDMIHVDVMDGHFVPNITIGPVLVKAMRPVTKLFIGAHLMIEKPWNYFENFIDAGVDGLSIHAECYGQRRESCREEGQFPKEVEAIDVERAKNDILRIKKAGRKAFFVVNPGTPLCFSSLYPLLDGVLVMAVNPGFAKQKFMPMVLPKIQALRKDFQGAIAVDGGINELTGPEAVKAGADILITASYFFSAKSPREAVKYLKGL